MNKYLKYTLKGVGVVIIALILIFVFKAWQIKTGRIIILENGNWMTRADYLKKYPVEGTIFEDKNTPFDTYNEFYALIQKGDYDKAVLLIDDGDKNRRGMYLEALKKGGNNLDDWKLHLPSLLEKDLLKVDGNHASYDWKWNDGLYHPMNFSKNQDGFWRITEI